MKKILAHGLCATCYMLKRQDEECFLLWKVYGFIHFFEPILWAMACGRS